MLGGNEERQVKGYSLERQPAPARFRLPNHSFGVAPRWKVSIQSIDTRNMPLFSSAKLGSLPNGTAFVVTKGRKLADYTMPPEAYGAGETTKLRAAETSERAGSGVL